MTQHMTKKEVIEQTCAIRGLVYHSLNDYNLPNDGFCPRCDKVVYRFQSVDTVVNFMRDAVLEKLKREGHKISKDFDPETGKEILDEETTNPVSET